MKLSDEILEAGDPGHVDGLAGTFQVREQRIEADPFDAAVGMFSRGLQATSGAVLDRRIMPPEEWIDSPYHAGPFALDFLWPAKKLAFIEAARGGITTAILTGGIGTGKTALLVLIALYDAYRISCFSSPQAFLGLPVTSKLVSVFISMNQQKAIEKLFDPFKQAIDATPYFQKECVRDRTLESKVRFPGKNFEFRAGVTGEAAIHSEDVRGIYLTECVTGDSIVDTATGPQRICGMVGRWNPVWAIAPDGTWHLKLATAKKIGVRNTIRIQLDSGIELRCTDNHEILTERGFIQAQYLREGDHVVSRSRTQRRDQGEDARGAANPSTRGANCDERGGAEANLRAEQGPMGGPRAACEVRGECACGSQRSCEQGEDCCGQYGEEAHAGAQGRCREEGQGDVGGPRPKSPTTRGAGRKQEAQEPGVLRGDLRAESRACRAGSLVGGGQATVQRGDEGSREEALRCDQGENERGSSATPADRWLRPDGASTDPLGADAVPQLVGTYDDSTLELESECDFGALRISRHPVRLRRDAEELRPRFSGGESAGGDIPGGGEAQEVSPDRPEDPSKNRGSEGLLHHPWLVPGANHRGRVEGRVSTVLSTGLQEEVFDLCVEDLHNYVANGIVVHNCNFYAIVEESRKKRGGEQLDVADDIVTQGFRRMESRFLRQGQLQLCRVVLDSSRQYPGDFVERYERMALRGEAPYPTTVFSFSQWGAKKGALDPDGKPYYSGETFPVEVGVGNRASRILDPSEVPHVTGMVIDCAVEHRAAFVHDIDGSIRDLAGVAVEGLRPLIPQKEMLIECVRTVDQGFAAHQCRHPFTAPTTSLRDSVDMLLETLINPQTRQPWVNPGKLRVVHADPAVTGDAFGLAMGHIDTVVTVNRLTEGRLDLACMVCMNEQVPGRITCQRCAGAGYMKHFGSRLVRCHGCQGLKNIICPGCRGTAKHGTPIDRPRVYMDLMLKITPPKSGRIQFDDVEAMLDRLRSAGFMIAVVTADGHQSEFFLQRQLQKPGVVIADKLSLDIRKDPYFSFRDAIFDVASDGRRRLSFYDYEPFFEEARRVEERRDKIDHPHHGSKDICDGVAGVVHNCEVHEFLRESVTSGKVDVIRF